MSPLVIAYVMAAIMLALYLFGRRRMESQLETTEAADLRSLRTFAEATWLDWLLWSWTAMNAVGAVLLIMRGEEDGWLWLGPAALYGLASVLARKQRLHVRAELGDCGQSDHTERYRRMSRSAIMFFGFSLVSGTVQKLFSGLLVQPRSGSRTSSSVALVSLPACASRPSSGSGSPCSYPART